METSSIFYQMNFPYQLHLLCPELGTKRVQVPNTTNVEKERMMLLDAILGGQDVDIGRLICREILVFQGKNAGYLLFPWPISDLCVNASVEMKGEEKGYPMAAFPTVLKVKPRAIAASDDSTMLQQFMLMQKSIWEFQRKQYHWLTTMFTTNLTEAAGIKSTEFPDWVINEEMTDETLFEDEFNEEEEHEGVVEKKRKRSEVKVTRMETRCELKRGKRPAGGEVIEEEEEDALQTESDGESLSEGEKTENIDVMQELIKESEEQDPMSSEGEEFQDAGDKLDDRTDIEGDHTPNQCQPATEPIPNPPKTQTKTTSRPENQTPIEKANADLPANVESTAPETVTIHAVAKDPVFTPTKRQGTKHVAKKRRMAQVAEDKELDVEGVTAEEDGQLNATVDIVMNSVEDGAAIKKAAKKS